jgi:hypothetical protein
MTGIHDRGKNVSGSGALKAYHSGIRRMIGQTDIRKLRKYGLKMGQVFIAVGRIDDQQIVIRNETVKIGVVDGTALFVGNDRVLAFSDFQSGGIVGKDMLKEGERGRTADVDSTHVGDIENAGVISGGKMFLNNACPVLNRHVPSAECHHLSAKLDMLIMDNGFEQRFHKSPLYSKG